MTHLKLILLLFYNHIAMAESTRSGQVPENLPSPPFNAVYWPRGNKHLGKNCVLGDIVLVFMESLL